MKNIDVIARFTQEAYYDKYCTMLGRKVVSKRKTTPVLGTGVTLLKGDIYIVGLSRQSGGSSSSLFISKNTELIISDVDKKVFNYYKKIGRDDNNYVIQYRHVKSSEILEGKNKPNRKVITMQMIREYPVGVSVSVDMNIISSLYKFFLQYAPIINLECEAAFLAKLNNRYKEERKAPKIKDGTLLKGIEFDEEYVVFTGFTHTSRLDKKLALMAFADAIVEYVRKPDAKYPRLTSLKDVISLLKCEDWILQTLVLVP